MAASISKQQPKQNVRVSLALLLIVMMGNLLNCSGFCAKAELSSPLKQLPRCPSRQHNRRCSIHRRAPLLHSGLSISETMPLKMETSRLGHLAVPLSLSLAALADAPRRIAAAQLPFSSSFPVQLSPPLRGVALLLAMCLSIVIIIRYSFVLLALKSANKRKSKPQSANVGAAAAHSQGAETPLSLYDAIENNQYEELVPPTQRKLMFKRKEWRIKNDPSLEAERASTLFGEDEETHVVESLTPHSLTTELDSTSIKSSLPLSAHIEDAPADSLVNPNPISATSSDHSSTGSVSGFLNKLFHRNTHGRSIDLTTALTAIKAGDLSVQLGQLTARCLAQCVPESLTLPKGYPEDDVAIRFERSDELAKLHNFLSSKDLSQIAAGTFADLTNAFVVHIVDEIVCMRDDALKLNALDQLSVFMNEVGAMFCELFPNVEVEAIVYNGKTRYSKLEQLFEIYAKSALDVSNNLAGLLGSKGSSQNNPEPGGLYRAQNLDKLQLILGVKDSKRTNIEQKISRNMMWNMAKDLFNSGGGAKGAIGNVVGALKGFSQSPTKLPMNGMEQFSDLMNKDFGNFGVNGGGSLDFNALGRAAKSLGLPDFNDVDQANMASMTSNSLESLKQALGSGNLSAKDIAEFEQSFGIDMSELAANLNSKGFDPKVIERELGEGAVDLLRQMCNLKEKNSG